jgi:hypothetical protein
MTPLTVIGIGRDCINVPNLVFCIVRVGMVFRREQVAGIVIAPTGNAVGASIEVETLTATTEIDPAVAVTVKSSAQALYEACKPIDRRSATV